MKEDGNLLCVVDGAFCVLHARESFLQKDYEEAIASWNLARSIKHELGLADYLRLLKSCEIQKDNSLLIEVVEEAVSKYDLSEIHVRQIASILLRCEFPGEALLIVENLNILEEFSTNILAIRIHNRCENYEQALTIVDEVERRFLQTQVLTKTEQQLLLQCKILTLLHLNNLREAVYQSKLMVANYPDHYVGFQLCIRAMRSYGDHPEYLATLEKCYSIFPDKRDETAIHFSQALEMNGRTEESLSVLEDNQTIGKVTIQLLKRYLRDEMFVKFLNHQDLENVDSKEKLLLATDVLIVSIRNGHYEKISNLVSSIAGLSLENLEQHSLYLEFLNQLVQVNEILVSNITDTSFILSKSELQDLTNLINEHLPQDSHSASEIDTIVNRILWKKLLDSKYISYLGSRAQAISDLETYLDNCASHNSYLNCYECPGQSRMLALEIKKRIDNNIPTSLIRIGDGEGNFLDYPDCFLDRQKDDQEFIQRVWWDRVVIEHQSGRSQHNLIREFIHSLNNADIVGFPPIRRLLRTMNAPLQENGVFNNISRGLIAAANAFGSIVTDEKTITTSHVHTDFELWECYEIILGELSNVSVISCHDVSDYIVDRFGIQQVQQYLIPSESRYRNMFNQETAELHYPTRYEELLKILPTVSKNRVFLVGAGFLGKVYCNEIKKNGGIAIDVGSLLDRWAGFQTRTYNELGLICKGIRYSGT